MDEDVLGGHLLYKHGSSCYPLSFSESKSDVGIADLRRPYIHV